MLCNNVRLMFLYIVNVPAFNNKIVLFIKT